MPAAAALPNQAPDCTLPLDFRRRFMMLLLLRILDHDRNIAVSVQSTTPHGTYSTTPGVQADRASPRARSRPAPRQHSRTHTHTDSRAPACRCGSCTRRRPCRCRRCRATATPRDHALQLTVAAGRGGLPPSRRRRRARATPARVTRPGDGRELGVRMGQRAPGNGGRTRTALTAARTGKAVDLFIRRPWTSCR